MIVLPLKSFTLTVPVDRLLRLIDECVKRLLERREPEAVVHKVCILGRKLDLHVPHRFVQREPFEFRMRKMQNRRGGRFIDLARFDPDQPVLDQVDPADPVRSGNTVETVDELHGVQFLAVQRDRDSMEEIDLHDLRLVGRVCRIDGALVRIRRRLCHRVFQHAAFDARSPDVLVDRIRALHRRGDRNTMRSARTRSLPPAT